MVPLRLTPPNFTPIHESVCQFYIIIKEKRNIEGVFFIAIETVKIGNATWITIEHFQMANFNKMEILCGFRHWCLALLRKISFATKISTFLIDTLFVIISMTLLLKHVDDIFLFVCVYLSFSWTGFGC